MDSSDNQQSRIPYYSSKECSQGFCTLYCPQWCYSAFPPPPHSSFPDQESNLNFSPVVIAVIGILASVFLLISYYIVVSKYCRNSDSFGGRLQQDHPNEEFEDARNPLYHEPWQIETTGLDEAIIKSIAMCKYKKGDGFVEGTDCAVCLNEFRDDENLRLLPKCSHAFHLPCIDTWLKSHSNCPLCRATIISTSPSPLQLPSPLPESLPNHGSSLESQGDNEAVVASDDLERGATATEEINLPSVVVSKYHVRALSDLGSMESRDTVLEIEEYEEIQPIRRSLSMGPSCQWRASIADLLRMSIEDGLQARDYQFPAGVVSMIKRYRGEYDKGYKRSSVLHCVLSPIAMKRSSSSRRLLSLSPRHGGRNLVNLRGGNSLSFSSVGSGHKGLAY